MTRPSWCLARMRILPALGILAFSLSSRTLADEPNAVASKVTWPGMTSAGTVVLPNGWSLKPAGRQSRLGDFPVQIAVHPSEPILAVRHAGYGEHEVVTVNAKPQ